MLKRSLTDSDLTGPAARFASLIKASLIFVALSAPSLSPVVAASPLYLAQLASQAQISSAQAAKAVQERYGGRILNVDAREREGRKVYRVKVLQENGRIRTVNVDAQSGQLMGR